MYERESASSRGYNYRWQKYRESFLRKNPLCRECERMGRVKYSSVVDHIVPWRNGTVDFWDKSNHQPLCKECHDRKTARGDVIVGHNLDGSPVDPGHWWNK